MIERAKLIGLVLILTVLSGFADAAGFLHASRIWQARTLVPDELGKSGLGFAFGIVLYWLALRYLNQAGVVTPEVQTVLWFGVTLFGVAMGSGKFLRWPLIDQIVSMLVLIGIAWLLLRTTE